MQEYREFLKDTIRKKIDFRLADQNRGEPAPPIQKPYNPSATLYSLPPVDTLSELGKIDLFTAVKNRRSRRHYRNAPITMEELSFLLWSTQGIRQVRGHSSFRTVPSAGARHALETYVYARLVEGLGEAIYRYLPLDNKLVTICHEPDRDLSRQMSEACMNQRFTGKSAVTLVWTAVPYRMEWRYLQAAHKVIALDAGHVCQNLYLACESIGAGTCAVAAYDQSKLDELLGVDGEEEFAIYVAPVGKI